MPGTDSPKKAHKTRERVQKFEVICTKCKNPKPRMWTQKQYDKHMWDVHNFKNEQHIGSDPRTPEQRQLF